jgi:hypothetical protein
LRQPAKSAAFRLETVMLLRHHFAIRANDGHYLRAPHAAKAGPTFFDRRFFMRRATVLSAAAGIAVSALVVASPARAGYYLIRWDNTGVCQVWSEGLSFKPLRWPSDYEIVSKPFPTFSTAMAAKEAMRQRGRCTW